MVEDARHVVGRRVDALLAIRADSRVLVTRREHVVEPPGDVRPVLVVGGTPTTRVLDEARGVGTRQPHAQPVDEDDQIVRERTFAIGDRVLDDARHARVALQLRDATLVGLDHARPRLQPGDRRELDVLLTQ